MEQSRISKPGQRAVAFRWKNNMRAAHVFRNPKYGCGLEWKTQTNPNNYIGAAILIASLVFVPGIFKWFGVAISLWLFNPIGSWRARKPNN